MARIKRTDIHRAGAIIPADYTIVLSYAFPQFPRPSYGTIVCGGGHD